MSELVKVVKVNSIGSIGCWSNFEGVWEVSTSVGAVIRKQVSWSGIQACTWYQYWWQGPYQNLYDLRQYQPCTSFIWVSISGIYLPHSYQPKISLGSNIKTRLVWKASKSTKYRGPDWYEKASKSTKYRGPDWYENLKTYPMPGQAGSVFKSHAIPTLEQTPVVVTATLRIDNHDSQKSKNQLGVCSSVGMAESTLHLQFSRAKHDLNFLIMVLISEASYELWDSKDTKVS